MVGQEPLHRVRSKHTRSRTGCFTCKKRRVRCDEQRPKCLNCVKGSRACEYAFLGQSVRSTATKTKLPGVEALWQITPQVSIVEMDPFDSLPIEMPFKSSGLLKLFMQTNAPVGGIMPPERWREFLSCTKDDSVVCRSILIVAGIYFTGSAGGLREFEPAYLHHKLQCMNTVNSWLSNPETRFTARCLSLIGTLCSSEACLGNIVAAEHHLTGLMALFNMREKWCEANGNDWEHSDTEMVERYILLSQNLVATVKGNTQSGSASKGRLADPFQKDNSDAISHELRMDSLRLMPYFFTSTKRFKFCWIDSGPTIARLRLLTASLNRSNKAIGAQYLPAWSPGSMASMLHNYKRLHVESLSNPEKDTNSSGFGSPEKLMSSWGGLIAASTFFLYGVLGLRETGMPLNPGSIEHLFRMLSRELDSSVTALTEGKCNADFWLWKAFSSAMAMTRAQSSIENAIDLRTIRHLQGMTYNQVQVWSRTMRVEQWERAKEALNRVAWLDTCLDEEMASVWKAATKQNVAL